MKLDKALEINKSKYTFAQYKFISELIWGGVPTNRKEAEESSFFKDRADKILEQYPKLDVSFFEKHEDDEEDKFIAYLKSDKFKEEFAKQVEKDTWDKGFPKIYMNKEGQIVEHWKDGTINIIKDKES